MISAVEEVFTLWGVVFAVLRTSQEQESGIAGQVEISQGIVSLEASSEDWLILPEHESDLERDAIPTGGHRNHTYLAYFTDPQAAIQLSRRHPLRISSFNNHGSVTRFVTHLSRFTPQRLATTGLGQAVLKVLRKVGPPDVAAILLSGVRVEPLEALGPSYIDRAVAGGSGVVLDGWIAGLAHRDVHIVTADLRAFVPKPRWALRRRLDVHDHLVRTDGLESLSDKHGFAAVLPVEPEDNEAEIFFVECGHTQEQTTFYGPVSLSLRKDEREAFDILRLSFGDIQSLPKEHVDQVYRPFLSLPKGEAFAKQFRFGPPVPKNEPLVSIIIPFYGDAFFLNCVYQLQRVLGPGFELILVVDDTRIWPEIYGRLSSRSKSITIPTALLQNAGNYGFGRANNLGFMAAAGDVVLLMNSDILVTDSAPLNEAVNAIRGRQKGGEPDLVAGFSLLYEDNTIQHIGMEFPKSQQVGGLHLADHPMKGLPFGLYRGAPTRRVPAVTAALMGLSSDLYSRLNGFDTVYERGDFEDADLCLRAEQLGAEMQVFVRPGLYHLERQSIPSMGDSDLRQMVTYMNCVAFNDRWAGRLDQQPDTHSKPVGRFKVRKRVDVGA